MAGFFQLDESIYAADLQQADDSELEMLASIWIRQSEIELPRPRPETVTRLRLIRTECGRRGKPQIMQVSQTPKH